MTISNFEFEIVTKVPIVFTVGTFLCPFLRSNSDVILHIKFKIYGIE